jgi:cytochrome c oxidase subunit 3
MLNVMPYYLIYSLAIPFSNLLMLIISSIPIQCLQLMVKIGFMVPFIESLAQLIAISIIFIELQLKEFMFSNYSISDSIIGSLNYSATTLHGLHVIIGSINWLIIIINDQCIECNISIHYSSIYWHFIDIIWFIVFMLVILCYVMIFP